MTSITLSATERATGEVKLPGSKSISNRLLLLAALADGETTLHNVLDADDTHYLIDALAKLGVAVDNLGDNSYKIHGCNGKFSIAKAELFLGNAGTAFRPLTAALAFMSGTYVLQGDPRMYERPIGDLVEALRSLGAQIEYLENEGYPPLRISPFKDNGNAEVSIKGNISSQFLTALLMAAPLLKRTIEISIHGEIISKPYIDLTLNLLKQFGIEYGNHHKENENNYEKWNKATQNGKLPAPEIKPIDAKNLTCKMAATKGLKYDPRSSLSNNNGYQSQNIIVEGDASSASYFLAAGVLGGGPVSIIGVGKNSIQGDVQFARELNKLGANIEFGDNFIRASSPDNPLWQTQKKLAAFNIDANNFPDAAMTLAVLALVCDGKCTLKNIASWRVKETDRILAMTIELRKLGAEVIEGSDCIQIISPRKLNDNVTIDTYNDHRMAMCFSLVCLMGVSVTINNPECVSKTFPAYFEKFKDITSKEKPQ